MTIDEKLPGQDWHKYINNNGQILDPWTPDRAKTEALAHWSYEATDGQAMILDIQGKHQAFYTSI